MANTETDHVPDRAGVAVHPPLFYLSVLAIAYVLNGFFPLRLLHSGAARLAGLIPVILGLGIIAIGRLTMDAHGTNINPTKPTTTIIETGLYRFSRNPLYIALTITYCGLALLLNTWWPYILLPFVLATMHFLVVRREEGYLERKFGDVYRHYCARVRRYL